MNVICAADIVAELGGKWHGSYGLPRCLVNKDHPPSLSISDGRDGRLLVKCHGGCPQAKVIDALCQLDLWPYQAKEPSLLSEAERKRWRRQETERERA